VGGVVERRLGARAGVTTGESPAPCTDSRAWPGARAASMRSAYHKNNNTKMERAKGVIGDTLRAYANGRKDDWERQLPLAVFAINTAASTLGDSDWLTHFFIYSGAHLRLPLTAPAASCRHSTRGGCATWSGRCLTAAQQERKAKMEAGQVDTVFQVGGQELQRTKELLNAAQRSGHRQAAVAVARALPRHGRPSPKAYTLALPLKVRCCPMVKRTAQTLPRAGRRLSGSGPGVGPAGGAGGQARG
jgi:hypothetical protein